MRIIEDRSAIGHEYWNNIVLENTYGSDPFVVHIEDWDGAESVTFGGSLYRNPSDANEAAFEQWVSAAPNQSIPEDEAENLQEWLQGMRFGSNTSGPGIHVPIEDCRDMIKEHNDSVQGNV